MLNILPEPPKKYSPYVSDMTSPTTRQYETAGIPQPQLPVSPIVSERVPYSDMPRLNGGVPPQAAGVGAGIVAGSAIAAGAQGVKSYLEAKAAAGNASRSSAFAKSFTDSANAAKSADFGNKFAKFKAGNPMPAPAPGTSLIPVDGTYQSHTGNTNANFRGTPIDPPANIALRNNDPWVDASAKSTGLRINPTAGSVIKSLGKAGLAGAGVAAADEANNYLLKNDMKNGAFTDNTSPVQDAGTAGRIAIKGLAEAAGGRVPEMLLNAAGISSPSFADSPVKRAYDWATKSKNELAADSAATAKAVGAPQLDGDGPGRSPIDIPAVNGGLTPAQEAEANALKAPLSDGDDPKFNARHTISSGGNGVEYRGQDTKLMASPYSEQSYNAGNGNSFGINTNNPRDAATVERMRALAVEGTHGALPQPPATPTPTATPTATTTPTVDGQAAMPGASAPGARTQGSAYPVNSDGYRKEQSDIVAARRGAPEATPVQSLPRYQAPTPDYSGQIQAGLQQINDNANSSFDSIGTMVANKSKRAAGQAMVDSGQHSQGLANAANEHNIDRNISQNNLEVARGDHAVDRAELKAQHEQAQKNFESTALASKANHSDMMGLYGDRLKSQDEALKLRADANEQNAAAKMAGTRLNNAKHYDGILKDAFIGKDKFKNVDAYKFAREGLPYSAAALKDAGLPQNLEDMDENSFNVYMGAADKAISEHAQTKKNKHWWNDDPQWDPTAIGKNIQPARAQQ